MHPPLKWTSAALLVAGLGGLTAHAQQRPAATDPASSVPEPKYESAFRGYRPYVEPTIAPWGEVNREVGRVGGHRGIFGGSAAGAPAPGSPAQPTGVPAAAQGQAPVRGAPQGTASDGHH